MRLIDISYHTKNTFPIFTQTNFCKTRFSSDVDILLPDDHDSHLLLYGIRGLVCT